MTKGHWISLASAALGALGTVILFRSSYAMEPMEGAPFNSDPLMASNAEVKRRNRRRHRWQLAAIALLCLSFIAQGIAVFVP